MRQQTDSSGPLHYHLPACHPCSPSRLRLRPSARPHTRGLPSAARPPNTEHRHCDFPFAASRLRVSQLPAKFPTAQPQQHRTSAQARAASFVSIRIHSWFKSHLLRLSVNIRVHPWRKRRPWQANCLRDFAASREPNSLQSYPATRQQRTQAQARTASFVSIRGSKLPLTKPRQDRSRAGKPELHSFVSIRVHSCPFVVQNTPSQTTPGPPGDEFRNVRQQCSA